MKWDLPKFLLLNFSRNIFGMIYIIDKIVSEKHLHWRWESVATMLKTLVADLVASDNKVTFEATTSDWGFLLRLLWPANLRLQLLFPSSNSFRRWNLQFHKKFAFYPVIFHLSSKTAYFILVSHRLHCWQNLCIFLCTKEWGALECNSQTLWRLW